MKLMIKENYDNDYLFEMANVRGKNVRVPHKLDFSFTFTTKDSAESKDINHGFRVKPVFNPEKVDYQDVGTLKMFGDWSYTPGKNDTNIKAKQIREMKAFFKEYKILFAAVWEKVLQQDAVQEYFRGIISLQELIQEFDFYNDYKEEMDEITTLNELYFFVKENNLFNTWDK